MSTLLYLLMLFCNVFLSLTQNNIQSFGIVISQNELLNDTYSGDVILQLNWRTYSYKCIVMINSNETEYLCDTNNVNTSACDFTNYVSPNSISSISISTTETDTNTEPLFIIDKLLLNMENMSYMIDSFCIDNSFNYSGLNYIESTNCSVFADMTNEYGNIIMMETTLTFALSTDIPRIGYLQSRICGNI